MATINQFKANLIGAGPRNNRFEVFIPRSGTKIQFLCKTAALPGQVIEPMEIKYKGLTVKLAGDRTFESWTVTVLNDTDFNVRNAMERWMNGINAHQANTGLTNPVDYQADLIVEQLDRDESVIKTYNFRGCFPINVSAIDVNYETVDTVEEFTTEFAVQYWESGTTS